MTLRKIMKLVTGKTKMVHSHYHEVTIPLEEIAVPFRKINFVVRAFNDGIAFRYEFPQQQNWSSFSLTDEHTTFNLAGNPNILTLLLPNYTTSHEGEYSNMYFLSELKEDTLMDMPAFLNFPVNIYGHHRSSTCWIMQECIWQNKTMFVK